jgi:hypothetical protein
MPRGSSTAGSRSGRNRSADGHERRPVTVTLVDEGVGAHGRGDLADHHRRRSLQGEAPGGHAVSKVRDDPSVAAERGIELPVRRKPRDEHEVRRGAAGPGHDDPSRRVDGDRGDALVTTCVEPDLASGPEGPVDPAVCPEADHRAVGVAGIAHQEGPSASKPARARPSRENVVSGDPVAVSTTTPRSLSGPGAVPPPPLRPVRTSIPAPTEVVPNVVVTRPRVPKSRSNAPGAASTDVGSTASSSQVIREMDVAHPSGIARAGASVDPERAARLESRRTIRRPGGPR